MAKMAEYSSALGRAAKALYTAFAIVIVACIIILWIKAGLVGIFIAVGIVLLLTIAIWVSIHWQRHRQADANQ